ncbi:hypothetical protein H2202_001740 [Exophiala xenobiotica]|nr:hypothetical protein H2202_001740 [Exophiala xenobiotica]KAK5238551.1 hypothetical protein LTR47_000294 [Exophiala xenobiotica]KAK5242381.1 hypothetical protein LTS06_011561 [Exophiala xenobiotica]KAK5281226.1 hypothetical protein LTR40_005176 [Exophiala xenobiotica]KAK5325535.1 hypothetical protein LTR93_003755 [Exophiala xenobiotica]
MHLKPLFLSLVAATTALALPLAKAGPSDNGSLCLGSSFSPTNCNSPGADSVNVDPTIDISPTVVARAPGPAPARELDGRDDADCIGSSFSPTNCNSPGADSVNVDPDIDISPTVDVSGVTDAVTDVVSDVTARP